VADEGARAVPSRPSPRLRPGSPRGLPALTVRPFGAAASRPILLLLAATLVVTALTTGRVRSAPERPPLLDFALIGDTPYTALEEIAFDGMMADLDGKPLAFVVHVGDFKNGGSPCTDELFRQRFELFNASAHPFVFLFGDNEWTDCHRPSAGGYDPVERLRKLREIFTAGDRSLGKRSIALERQSADARWAKFRENVRWVHGGVVFVGLNEPGSNNHRGRAGATDEEWAERNEANIAWVRAGFREAVQRRAPAIVLALQANPFFELPRGARGRSGFESFLAAVEAETIAYSKPVAFVHGDTHVFRVDRPLGAATGRVVENLTRVEVHGSPITAWVRGHIDAADPAVFSFRSEVAERSDDRSRP
jgi:hypothetical protein